MDNTLTFKENTWALPSSIGDKKVTKVSGTAFNDKDISAKLIISPFVTEIADGGGTYSTGYYGAFSNNKISIMATPWSLTNIGSYAFQSNLLPKLVLKDVVKTIGVNSFAGNKLVSIDTENGLQTIGGGAFASNNSANVDYVYKRNSDGTDDTSVVNSYTRTGSVAIIPNGITQVMDYAFYSTGTSGISFSDSLTFVGSSAFAYCNLTNVSWPSNVEEIAPSTFASNYSLTSIILHDGLKKIGSNAFNKCNFTKVEIPSTVETIENMAFYKYKNPDVYNSDSNINLNKIVNKTGKQFDWSNIVNGYTSDPFATGTLTNSLGNVQITSE